MRLLMRVLITAGVIFGVAFVSDGSLLSVDGVWAAMWGAVTLGVVNAIVKPVVKLFSLPITILTLGLFALVINAGMLYLTAAFVPGIDTVGFFPTMIAALIIAMASSILTKLIDKED